MQIFDELGDLIERRWRDRNYNDEVFPEITVQALADAELCKKIGPWDIIRWLFKSRQIPPQTDLPGRFGDPPVTLYAAPRFHIDVYYWLEGTTSIHQHAFCGAFQVLAGSSIHSAYKFHCREQINEHFLIGELRMDEVTLLRQGAIRPIPAGKDYLHSLFHLDHPSATICIRTYHTASGSPQYDYRKPYFAVNPFFEEPFSTRQIQGASLLLRARQPHAIESIAELLAGSDFHTAFRLLEMAHGHLGNRELEHAFGLTLGKTQFERLVESARQRHGERVDLALAVFEEAQRQDDLVHRRRQITGNEHRFFIALLLNVPDYRRILEMVHQRFPESDPVETVLAWMEELSTTKVWGSSEPNVLGIADLDDDYLFALQCLFKGVPRDRMHDAFTEEFSLEYATSLRRKPEELFDAICGSVPFGAIFRRTSSTGSAQTFSTT